MFGFLRAFTSMFQGSENATFPALGGVAGTDNRAFASGDLAQLSAKLGLASQLLIVPTSGSVGQVSAVLESVQGEVERLRREMMQADPALIRSLEADLKRVRSLVEGALRVQWTQMRSVMALTQSYLPGGGVSHWQPTFPKVDFRV
jgi:hypothetical protein